MREQMANCIMVYMGCACHVVHKKPRCNHMSRSLICQHDVGHSEFVSSCSQSETAAIKVLRLPDYSVEKGAHLTAPLWIYIHTKFGRSIGGGSAISNFGFSACAHPSSDNAHTKLPQSTTYSLQMDRIFMVIRTVTSLALWLIACQKLSRTPCTSWVPTAVIPLITLVTSQSTYYPQYAPNTAVDADVWQLQLLYGQWSGTFNNVVSFPVGKQGHAHSYCQVIRDAGPLVVGFLQSRDSCADSLFLDTANGYNYWAATTSFTINLSPRSQADQDRLGVSMVQRFTMSNT